MQLIYQMSVMGEYSDDAVRAFVEQHASDEDFEEDYFYSSINIFRMNRAAIDAAIERSSDNWKINRIAKVDLAILRLAVNEILFLHKDDIPVAATANEVVDLAKKYGSDSSGAFVNGVLGKIIRSDEDVVS